MHHPTDRITHTTAFVTPVVEHWLEREIAQWVHPMKDRSDEHSTSELHPALITIIIIIVVITTTTTTTIIIIINVPCYLQTCIHWLHKHILTYNQTFSETVSTEVNRSYDPAHLKRPIKWFSYMLPLLSWIRSEINVHTPCTTIISGSLWHNPTHEDNKVNWCVLTSYRRTFKAK